MNYHCVFSPCRSYRYVWQYHWLTYYREFVLMEKPRYAMFIGLNPSTADETKPDPTVRRCIRFAKDWGYDGLIMTNLFAWRATLPRDMKAEDEPVGGENDEWLLRLAQQAGVVVAAWGTHGTHLRRDGNVRALLAGKLHYLRLTKDGLPSHPLYLPANLTPIRWQ